MTGLPARWHALPTRAGRHGVIENEFGEASIDSELLVQALGEQIVKVNNDCICCSMRGDLARIRGELRAKRLAGRPQCLVVPDACLRHLSLLSQHGFISSYNAILLQ